LDARVYVQRFGAATVEVAGEEGCRGMLNCWFPQTLCSGGQPRRSFYRYWLNTSGATAPATE